MNTERESTSKSHSGALQLFFFGPSIGESIVVHLPDGQWGVVDCYTAVSSKVGGVREFLKQKKVNRLAFFCLTHPHADHFLGADQLLQDYAGRVDRIWRYPGFTSRDVTARVILAAKVKARRMQDPEALQLADEFVKVLAAIDAAKRSLGDEAYRRVIGPMALLQADTYTISALRPTSRMVDDIEPHIARRDTNRGYLLLGEEEGAILNSLSVVLLIEFGEARAFLLADSQGARDSVRTNSTHCAAIKIAHHGSSNGLGAGGFGGADRPRYGVRCAVITPYIRSRLPSAGQI
jgi:hypothetical protein